eukprot:CAMPEP_0171558318 /NCGR_PEP_ID=MMETSP0960-20121227/11921_1 /TAXON_ID=87120 /ORGANISM="Aurantiochytrium limacinum, Strain ATCCMYA-1381" /LENGTH=68 /DNA_ID=CAMNT_0012109087 /DNA_START=177 /DNA_END=380 /DNA_ORIENTATION=+
MICCLASSVSERTPFRCCREEEDEAHPLDVTEESGVLRLLPAMLAGPVLRDDDLETPAPFLSLASALR